MRDNLSRFAQEEKNSELWRSRSPCRIKIHLSFLEAHIPHFVFAIKEKPMETITIRPAIFEDYDAVCTLFEQVDQLHAHALPDVFQRAAGPARPQGWFAQMSASEDTFMFVAEQQGLLVGLVLCDVRSSPAFPLFVPRCYVHISELVVHESFQRQGIGRFLMQRVHAWAQEQGITDIELDVYEFNTPARTLYEHLGYETMRRSMWHHLL